MKHLLIVACLLLTSCTAFIPKKANYRDEAIVRGYIGQYVLKPGTVEYFGASIYNARSIYGQAWNGNKLGYFAVVIDPDTNKVETFWSEEGKFAELENRLFLNTVKPAL